MVRHHVEAMLAEARAASADGDGLPRYVQQELDRYLRCGLLCHGFARVRCATCGDEILVAFSCKNRGVCPSCTTRRMHDTAADLVDRVLPRAPYRQWVLTLPFDLRLVLARHPDAVSAVLRVFLGVVFSHLRRQGRRRGLRGQPGAVTFVQRFGGLVNLNVHFHALVADGLFTRAEDGAWRFHALPPPSDEDVAAILARVAARARAHLAAWPAPDDLGPDPILAVQASAAQLPLAGILPAPDADHAPPARRARRCARVDGFSLHANRHVAARSRAGLEALCRYGARPPIALGRVALLGDGQVLYRLKAPLGDGRRALVFEPVQFLRRLAALVPPPRHHLVRYAGVLAPRAAGRATLVPPVARPAPSASLAAVPPARRIPWADLLRRVFAVDVLRCPCGGRRQVIAFISEPEVVVKILDHLGLPSLPPPVAAARPPPMADWTEDWTEAADLGFIDQP